MSTSTIILIAVIAVIVLLGLWFISIYNELVKERVLVQEGYSGVGAQLQLRNDTLPNMVEVVKGYAGHENKTLVEVIKWRNQSAAATTMEEQNTASKGLNQAMLNFQQLTEAYPDLKANENFLKLQDQLQKIEEDINHSRRYYNGTVREYNQSIAVFPKNLVSGMFGFKAEAFFKEDETAHTVPKVSFT